nr:C-glucosyltransferase [Iris domestica]
MPSSGDRKAPHLALVASAGMGHLGPMTRLAAALSSSGGCDVSLVTAQPTVSLAESDRISQLLAAFPAIRSLALPLVELEPAPDADPFFLRFDAICRSADALPPLLLHSSPAVSALVVDITLASAFAPVAKKMNLACYIYFSSSAAMLSLCAYFPTYCASSSSSSSGDIDVNGVFTLPKASVPPLLRNPNHPFTVGFLESGRALPEADAILINTFNALEPEALSALNAGRVVQGLPPVAAVGPLLELPSGPAPPPAWLDLQPAGSVVYVSFGNRTAMGREQMRELGLGLEMSGCRFLWVVKTKKVDRDEEEEKEAKGRRLELEVLGEGYSERVGGRGLVVSGWVEQVEVLRHRAVGGFVSHCGWNSVTEAAMAGVRVLGWPRIGDQRVNGGVVRKSGLGVWMEEWGWEAEGGVVGRDEVAERIREMMADEELRRSAARIGEEARSALGSSRKELEDLVRKLGA